MNVDVTVTLPDNLVQTDSNAVSRDVFEQVVAAAYKNGHLGPKQVRLLLGFSSRFETEDFLHQRHALEYTIEDFESDMETMSKLGLR